MCDLTGDFAYVLSAKLPLRTKHDHAELTRTRAGLMSLPCPYLYPFCNTVSTVLSGTLVSTSCKNTIAEGVTNRSPCFANARCNSTCAASRSAPDALIKQRQATIDRCWNLAMQSDRRNLPLADVNRHSNVHNYTLKQGRYRMFCTISISVQLHAQAMYIITRSSKVGMGCIVQYRTGCIAQYRMG